MKNRIKDLRDDKDLRQIDVANAIGITQRKYSYIETGSHELTADIACKLADFYNTSVDYILFRTDVKTPYPKLAKKPMFHDSP